MVHLLNISLINIYMFNPIGNSPKSDKSNSRSNSITSINSLKSNSSDDSELAGLYQNMEEMTFNSDGAVRPTPEPSGRNINPKTMKRSIKIHREIGSKRGRDSSPDESLGSMEELNINSDNSFSDTSTLPSSPDAIDQEYDDILSVLTETHFQPTENKDSNVYFDAWIETITSKEFIEGVKDNNLISVAIAYLRDDKKMYERTLQRDGLSQEVKDKLVDRIEKINATIELYENENNNTKRRKIGVGGKRKTRKNKFTAGDEEKQYTFDAMVYILMLSDVRGPEKYFKSIKINQDGTRGEETYLGKLTMLLDDKLIFENGREYTRIARNESEQIRFVIVNHINRPTLAAGRKRKTKKQFLFNPNDPKKSFDVYIDKNPKDTIPIKYTTVKDVEDTIKKLERLYKEGKYSHKRIWQVGMILKVRLAAMKKNQKKYYPKAKNVTKRLRLSEKYFKFLKKRTREQDNKTRKNMKFKF